jgi:pectate lyase
MNLSSGLALAGLIAFGGSAPAQAQDQKLVPPTPGQAPPLPPRLPEGVPAFPGAWGGGMFITGGRGGRILQVTNLNDSGPGSLRAAVEAEGPRIVMFRVAGILHLQSALLLNHPDITIAGQSAPGDGICLANDSLYINTHNVIVRHLRVRRGQTEVARARTTSAATRKAR